METFKYIYIYKLSRGTADKEHQGGVKYTRGQTQVSFCETKNK